VQAVSSADWTTINLDASQFVANVLRGIYMADLSRLNLGNVGRLELYALVDAEGNLSKAKPADMAKATTRLLERYKPLADQLGGSAASVAGGYFVVKAAAPPTQRVRSADAGQY
jgi:hypothetical protein